MQQHDGKLVGRSKRSDLSAFNLTPSATGLTDVICQPVSLAIVQQLRALSRRPAHLSKEILLEY